MDEEEQLQAADEPVREVEARYPGTTRRRTLLVGGAAVLVVILVVVAVLFVSMNHKIDKLNRTVAEQSQQIQHLQTEIDSVKGSLGAAVACLQTVGVTNALCAQLIK